MKTYIRTTLAALSLVGALVAAPVFATGVNTNTACKAQCCATDGNGQKPACCTPGGACCADGGK